MRGLERKRRASISFDVVDILVRPVPWYSQCSHEHARVALVDGNFLEVWQVSQWRQVADLCTGKVQGRERVKAGEWRQIADLGVLKVQGVERDEAGERG